MQLILRGKNRIITLRQRQNQRPILRPIQLRPQCGRNWKFPKELTRTFQLPHSEATSKFRLQNLGQITNQKGSIFGSFLSFLFFFKNSSSKMPVHLNSAIVHTANGITARSFNNHFRISNKKHRLALSQSLYYHQCSSSAFCKQLYGFCKGIKKENLRKAMIEDLFSRRTVLLS